MPPVFKTINFWQDTQARTGAENMAVDQLLMQQVGDRAILRIYDWSEPTVTFGYFLPLSEATHAFGDADLNYVRRWTGGGVVDHRRDLTYSLIVPRSHSLATARGAESYRIIHQILANCLKKLGIEARLTVVDEGDGGASCFTNPVAYDLTDNSGQKIAGAGQRRSKHGLLHQGSLMIDNEITGFGHTLANEISADPRSWAPDQDFLSDVSTLASQRYATSDWLEKRTGR